MSRAHDVPVISPARPHESEPDSAQRVASEEGEARPLHHPPIHRARVDLARRDEVLRILQEARQRDEGRAQPGPVEPHH